MEGVTDHTNDFIKAVLTITKDGNNHHLNKHILFCFPINHKFEVGMGKSYIFLFTKSEKKRKPYFFMWFFKS